MWIYSFMANHLTLVRGSNSRPLCLRRPALLLKTCWRLSCCYHLFIFFNPVVVPCVAASTKHKELRLLDLSSSQFSLMTRSLMTNGSRTCAKCYLFECMYFFFGLNSADLGSLAELSRSEVLHELGEKLLPSARRTTAQRKKNGSL